METALGIPGVRRIDAGIDVRNAKTPEEQMREPVALFRGLETGFLLLGSGALLLSGAIFPWPVGAGGPGVFAAVSAVLAGAVVAALVGPLHRALAIRPADALRAE